MNDAGSSVPDISLEKVAEKQVTVLKSIPRTFTTIFLPHRNPESKTENKKVVPAWSRIDQDIEFVLFPGVIEKEKEPFSETPDGRVKINKQTQTEWERLWPYGTKPRLFLIWATTKVEEARRAEADLKANRLGASLRYEESRKHVNLEENVIMIPSFSDFVREVEGSPEKRVDARTVNDFRRQIEAFCRSTIIIKSHNELLVFNLDADPKDGESREVSATDQFTIAKKILKLGTAGICMQFNPHVFEWLFKKNIPVVYDDAIAFTGHPMAFDIYLWLSTRLFGSGKEFLATWDELCMQFGGTYERLRAFREKFISGLEKVLDLMNERYAESKGWRSVRRVEVTEKGVILRPGFNVVDEAKRKGRVLLEGAPEFGAVPMRSLESPVSTPVPVPVPVRGSVSPVGVSDEVVESVLVFLRNHKPFVNALRVEGTELRLRRVVEKWVGQGFGFSDFEKAINRKNLPDELIRCDGFLDSRMSEFSVLRGDVVESEAKRKLGQLWCSVEEHRLSHQRVYACDLCREKHLSHGGLHDVDVVGCVKCRIERELSAVRVLQLLGKD